MSDDLGSGPVAEALGDRPARSYPALLATEPAAMSWARAGAPAGAVVVADYQASPRGRGGFPWQVQPGHGLGFSLVLRPGLPAEREGWPYVAGTLALGETLASSGAALEWPDTVEDRASGAVLARLGVYGEVGDDGVDWAVLTVLVEDAVPPRAPLLARLVGAVERRLAEPPETVLDGYRPVCATLGRGVRARLIPLGPGGPEVVGEAVDVLVDGALVIRTEQGRRVAVPPLNLGLLEPPAPPAEVPPDVLGRRIP